MPEIDEADGASFATEQAEERTRETRGFMRSVPRVFCAVLTSLASQSGCATTAPRPDRRVIFFARHWQVRLAREISAPILSTI